MLEHYDHSSELYLALSTAMTSNRQSSTNARRRNTRGPKASSDNSDSQALSSESPDSRIGSDQCEICFEDRNVKIVRLYPCKHSDICLGCVIKLLVSNRRECPFCRAHIDGFEEGYSSQLFGWSVAVCTCQCQCGEGKKRDLIQLLKSFLS